MLRRKPPRIAILSLLLSLVVFSIAWAGEGYAPPVVGNISSEEALDEIVITSPSGGKIYVRTAKGELLEGSWPVSFTGWVCAEPTLADLDSDSSDLEIVVPVADSSDQYKIKVLNGDGSILWSHDLTRNIYSSPVVGKINEETILFLGSNDGKVYAWDVATWESISGWPKDTGSGGVMYPVVGDVDGDGEMEVLASSSTGNVYGWDYADGIWSERPVLTASEVSSRPSFGNITSDSTYEVVLGTLGSGVYAWDSLGNTLSGWPVSTESPISSSPVIGDVNGDGSQEIAVVLNNGKIIAWKADGSRVTDWNGAPQLEIYSNIAMGQLDEKADSEVVTSSKGIPLFYWSYIPGHSIYSVEQGAFNWQGVDIGCTDFIPPVITIDPVSSPISPPVILSYTVSDDVSAPENITVTGDESPYTEPGEYHVVLTATDEAGNSSTASVDFIIMEAVVDEDGSIQEAIDAVSPGETVSVMPGTYYGNIVMKNGVSLVGAGPGVSIIVGDGSGPVITCDGISEGEISGFTITSGNATYGGGIYCNNSSLTIKNNIIVGNSASYGGGIACLNSSPSIINNTIADNAATVYGGGIYCENSSSTIRNNVITNSLSGEGIYAQGSPYPVITYNNVWNNAAGNYGGISDQTDSKGNISNNPLYIEFIDDSDYLNDDYHLQVDSPSINSGDSASNYSNEPLPNGSRINMGAYGNTSEAATRVPASYQHWTQTTQEDFSNGTLDGVEVSSSPGKVKLSTLATPTEYRYFITNEEILVRDDAEIVVDGSSFYKYKTLIVPEEIPFDTTLRIKFDLSCEVIDGPGGYIRRNGIEVGELQTAAVTGWITFSQDIPGWNAGDSIELWAYGEEARTRNFRLYGRIEPVLYQGTFTSSYYYAGEGANWDRISWTEELPEGTDLKFQIRSANSVTDLLYNARWRGPLSNPLYDSTPEPSEEALMIKDLENAHITTTRSSSSQGWRFTFWGGEWYVFPFSEDGVYDNSNTFYDSGSSEEPLPLMVGAWHDYENLAVQAGDTLEITYDGGQKLTIYLPAIIGDEDTELYVATDGSTYYDAGLTQLAQRVGRSYYTLSSGEKINSFHDNNRYIQYRAYFSTNTPLKTPTLSEVTLTYISGPSPTIYSVTPNFGLNTGTTDITINGDNFIATPRVKIGTTECSNVEWLSAISLSARVPSGMTLGTYDLRVSNPGGRSVALTDAFTVLSPDGDYDEDGLTNIEEINTYHTDPLDPDTDNDGFSDGAEVGDGSNPNDPDSIPSFASVWTQTDWSGGSGQEIWEDTTMYQTGENVDPISNIGDVKPIITEASIINISNNSGWSVSPSLSLDVNGHPHIAWRDYAEGNYDIYYKYWDGTAWQTLGGDINISNTSGSSWSPSLSLDSSGYPHIAWYDNTEGNDEIYYKYWDGTAWQTLEGDINISHNSGASSYPSLSLDSNNNPHIAWRDYAEGNYDIYYKYWDGTSWQTLGGNINISNNSGWSVSPSLSLDVNGHPHIAWRDYAEGNYDIYYKYWDGTSWQTLGDISISNTHSYDPSLALDPNGYPYIAWSGSAEGGSEIYYKYWDGTAWQTLGDINISQFMTDGDDEDSSLSLDPNGYPHIAWNVVGGDPEAICYKHWDGTAWQTLGGDIYISPAGFGCSLSIDVSSRPHIAWCEGSDGEIYYYRPACDPGTLISSKYDAGLIMVDWGSISWDATTPEGANIKFRTRTSSDGSSWSDWGDYYTESGSPITSPNHRWIQYEATLETTDPEAIPVLQEVRISYAKFVPPTVSSITPSYGLNDRDTDVSINGASFLATPTVKIGTTECTNVVRLNSTILSARISSGILEGIYDVTVTNPDEQSGTLTNGFTVLSPDGDHDGDGLTNIEEIDTYHTDPFDSDTDDDGFSDGTEIEDGSDPNDSDSIPTVEYVWTQTDWSGGSGQDVWEDTTMYQTGENVDPISSIGDVEPELTEANIINISNNSRDSEHPSLSLDSSGHPHIAWQDSIEGPFDIYYKYWDGTAWQTLGGDINISNDSGYSGYPSLSLDANGHPRIVWRDNTEGKIDIYYKYWDGTAWQTLGGDINISHTSYQSSYPSLSLDSNGHPHIAWCDYTEGNYEVYYKYWDGTTWQTLGGDISISNTSDNINDPEPSLALDSNNHPHIAWDNRTEGMDIYYKYWDGTAWQTLGGDINISNTSNTSRSPSLSLDSNNNPHIAWEDITEGGDSYYKYWDGTAWQTLGGDINISHIGSEFTGGASLALDSNGYPHIVWLGDQEEVCEIRYKYWDGTAWQTLGGDTNISNTGGCADSYSFSLDARNRPHIAWRDEIAYNNGEIYYYSPACHSGTLISSAYDAGPMVDWQTISWDATTPEGSNIKFRTRTSSDGSSWSDWSSCYTESGSSITSSDNRWIQYEATLETTDPEAIPVLQEVRISYAKFVPPTVSSITPSYGLNDRDTDVSISGASFLDTPTVKIGTTECTNVVRVNSTTLGARVPSGIPEGIYDVTVTNPDEQSGTLTNGFTVLSPDGDYDGDGLTNIEEIDTYGTDPFDSDTDDDGMPDGWEVDNDLNPLVDDANLDPDGDGYTNLEEYLHNTDPQHKPITIYVDTDATEEGDGSRVNPYPTIAQGISAASFGATIQVAAGTYQENIILPANNNLIGAGANVTFIEGSGDVITTPGSNTIQGFTIKGNASGAGIKLTDASSCTIRNNILTNNYDGVYLENSSSIQIINNTIVENSASGIYSSSSSLQIENSIITNNDYGINSIDSSPTISYSDIWGNSMDYSGMTDPTGTEGNISSDPLYVDSGNNNYHLGFGSPCRDKGNPESEYNDPDDSRNDMGVYGGPYSTIDSNSPVVKVDAAPLEGTIPLEVEFNAEGCCDEWGIVSYAWDFDISDGIQIDSTLKNPVHTYTETGGYLAMLTVTDNSGFTASDTVSIRVNSPPTISPQVTPIAGTLPLGVEFTSNGINVASHAWDFDISDGIQVDSSEENPIHIYAQPGFYVATLIAANSDGASTTSTVKITVVDETITPQESEEIKKDQGGRIEVKDPESKLFGARVSIPPDALPQDSMVITIGEKSDPPVLPVGVGSIGAPIDLAPEGTVFSKSLTIGIPYSDADLDTAGLSQPREMKVYSYDKSKEEWSEVEVDHIYQGLVFISSDHFSLYQLGYTIPGGGGGSSGEGKGCFIATAAYGTPLAGEVEILRGFRDECLLTHRTGKALVRFYYRISPPLAKFISQRELLRTIARAELKPLVWLMKKILE